MCELLIVSERGDDILGKDFAILWGQIQSMKKLVEEKFQFYGF